MADENEKPTPESTTDTPPETQPEKIGVNGADANDDTGGEEIKLSSKALAERLARAERKAVNDLLARLEAKDESELLALRKAEKERKEAEMTELEKLNAKLSEKDNAIAEANAKVEALLTAQRNRDLDARILEIVSDKEKGYNAVSAKAVLALLRTNAESVAKMMDEDGKIKDAEITKAIEAVKASDPDLFRARPQMPGSPSNNGGVAGTTNRNAEQARKEMAARRARYA